MWVEEPYRKEERRRPFQSFRAANKFHEGTFLSVNPQGEQDLTAERAEEQGPSREAAACTEAKTFGAWDRVGPGAGAGNGTGPTLDAGP